MTTVNGFGKLQDDMVIVRTAGQSYTCREKRAALTVANDSGTNIAFVRLDGGVYQDGNSCDYSISSQVVRPQGFLLELKGRDMVHAIKQLSNTLLRLKGDGISVCYRRACVVSSGAQKIPSGGWQKHQRQFLSNHNVLLDRFSNHAQVGYIRCAS